MRDFGALLALLVLLPLTQPGTAGAAREPEPEDRDGVRVLVLVEGLPWSVKGDAEPHILEVGADGMRLVSEETGDGLIVRLGEGAAYVIHPRDGAYQKHTFDALSLAEKRRIDRARRLANLLEDSKLSDVVKSEYMKKHGLRRDGKVVVTMVQTDDRQRVGGHMARKVILLENDVPRVTLWMAPDVAAPRGLHRFFRNVAFLDEAMVEKITGLEGFPLAIEIDLDYKMGFLRLQMRAFDLEPVALGADAFVVPAGLRAWDVIKAERLAAAETKCPVCGERVDPRRHERSKLPGLDPVLYDKMECKQQDMHRLMIKAAEERG